MPDRTFSRRLSAAALAAVLVSGSGACGDDTGDRLPPPQSPGQTTQPEPSPSLSLTPEEQQAVEEVRAIFDEFMTAYVDLATSGAPPSEEALGRLLAAIANPLRGQVQTELVDNYREDRRLEGSLRWSVAKVVEAHIAATTNEGVPPWMRLQYCIDAHDWNLVDKATGRALSEGTPFLEPGRKHLAIIRASYFDPLGQGEPRWQIAEYEEEDMPC